MKGVIDTRKEGRRGMFNYKAAVKPQRFVDWRICAFKWASYRE